jgi:type I restriction enzyme S subunit
MSAAIEKPRSFRRVQLGEIADFVMGQAPPGDASNFDGNGTIFVKAGEFGATHPVIREWTMKPLKFAKSGDVLICVVGATAGKLNLGIDCAIGRSVAAIRPSKETFDRFVYLQLQPKVLELRSNSTGSAQGVISRDMLAKIEMVLPTLSEQEKIVGEIEKQFTRLEAGVAALRRVQANLKRYRAAVLKAACEGKLVPTEAELSRSKKSNRGFESPPSFETGEQLLKRILAERRKDWETSNQKSKNGNRKYKEPAAPDTANLPPLPEAWTWATLDAIAAIKSGITKDQNRKFTKPARSIPYLRVANVQRGHLDLSEVKEITTTEDEIQELLLQRGDILFNEGGDRDKLGRGWVWNDELPECIHQNHVFRARLFDSGLNPKLVSWYANTFGQKFFFDEGKHTTNLASISMTKLKGLPVPIPPPAEQTRIVAEVERRLSVVEELASVVSANLQRATRLRQSILQKAFTGELVKPEPVIEIANIVPSLKPEHIHGPNRHFARTLLSAEIVHQLHDEPTFGRIKHQKIFHLCEHIAQIVEIEGQYHREEAGPLDNKLIYTNEAELKKQKWYQEIRRKPYGHAYQPLAKAGGHRKYVERYWSEKLPVIEKLIELMRKWDTDRCEIFCTAYAAWNDLVIWGKETTEENILHEILERWHDSKRRFPRERWLKAIGWMKKQGFVPSGFGKPTIVS